MKRLSRRRRKGIENQLVREGVSRADQRALRAAIAAKFEADVQAMAMRMRAFLYGGKR